MSGRTTKQRNRNIRLMAGLGMRAISVLSRAKLSEMCSGNDEPFAEKRDVDVLQVLSKELAASLWVDDDGDFCYELKCEIERLIEEGQIPARVRILA